MKNFQFSIFNFQFVLVFCLLFIPTLTSAFSANVFVDTGTENINALEATIHIPEGIRIDNINNGNSPLLFWIESPTYDDMSRRISFSGITPGGFQGKAVVFTISGNITVDDLDRFIFSGVQALKNDGVGTSAIVTMSIQSGELGDDTLPPEDFRPLIGQNQDIFDGKYFLVFTTQDKGVGIDHYEVREGYFGRFTISESPYLLKYQGLDKKIFVKAVDKKGNERTVVLEATNKNKWYRYVLFAILLMMFIVSLFVNKLWIKSGN